METAMAAWAEVEVDEAKQHVKGRTDQRENNGKTHGPVHC